MCIIDDFSKKTWVYFLVEELETLHFFKYFIRTVGKETCQAVKCLRTDCGSEFNSADFKIFCEEHGMKLQLTTAYSPQQNGVAELKNRTLVNMVRSIMFEKGCQRCCGQLL